MTPVTHCVLPDRAPSLAGLARLAIAVALTCGGCAHKTSPPAGAAGAADDDEVVRECMAQEMPRFLEALAGPVGAACARDAHAAAIQMFRAGAHIGVVRGTTVIHGMGLRAAAEEFHVEAAPKIAERTHEDEEKAAKDADEEMSKTAARLATGTCIDATTALDFIDKAAHCGSFAYDTDQVQTEFARGFGAVCEHILSAQECFDRADSAFKKMRRESGDAGAGGR
jgi:hypothetical protein